MDDTRKKGKVGNSPLVGEPNKLETGAEARQSDVENSSPLVGEPNKLETKARQSEGPAGLF